MSTLTVAMKIPILCERVVSAPALTFAHWLPVGKELGIPIAQNGIELVLWFDLEAAIGLKAEDITHQKNVLVHYVRVDAKIVGINARTGAYMRTKDFSRLPTAAETQVQGEYDAVAANLLRLTIDSVNRLISFARVIKGQYWLLDLDPEQESYQAFIKFEATGKIDGGAPFRFQPNTRLRLRIEVPNAERYISEQEWPEAIRFVQGDQRVPFLLELLARAERLGSQGHSRTALTEAVTALEIAVSAFGDSRDANEQLAEKFGGRLGIASLGGQIRAMGLRGSVRFLLPLLLPEDILPLEVIIACQAAVDERNNVVHNGQREVPDVRKHVQQIRRCCEILRKYGTRNTASDSSATAP